MSVRTAIVTGAAAVGGGARHRGFVTGQGGMMRRVGSAPSLSGNPFSLSLLHLPPSVSHFPYCSSGGPNVPNKLCSFFLPSSAATAAAARTQGRGRLPKRPSVRASCGPLADFKEPCEVVRRGGAAARGSFVRLGQRGQHAL